MLMTTDADWDVAERSKAASPPQKCLGLLGRKGFGTLWKMGVPKRRPALQ